MFNFLFIFKDFLLLGGTGSRKGRECQGREGVKVDKDYKDL